MRFISLSIGLGTVPAGALAAFMSYGYLAFGEARETRLEATAYRGTWLGLSLVVLAILTVFLAVFKPRWAHRASLLIAVLAVAWLINYLSFVY